MLFPFGPAQELEDYFYYSQLRSQGIDTMETRQVSEHICLSELPFVMRAIGFYPSEEKVGRAPARSELGWAIYIKRLREESLQASLETCRFFFF